MLRLFAFSIIVSLLSCTHADKEKAVSVSSHDSIPVNHVSADTVHLHKLDKLFITGDFDGDKKIDTIFQHNFSRADKKEIDSSASPFENDWDVVEKWFYDKDADVYLSFNKPGRDSLHLGIAQGLYCLINVGDLNDDGKDEIALVIDHLDLSRVNTCSIYSLCNNEWKEMKSFSIFEGSFDFTGTAPIFTEIRDHLEKQNGKWVYLDYSQVGYDTPEEVGKMKPLKISACIRRRPDKDRRYINR